MEQPVRRAFARIAGHWTAWLLVALGAALAAPLAAPARAAGTQDLVRWDQQGDFASLLARAGKAKKMVFVDFYATWCGPCKMLDRTVYPDSGAAAAANRMLSRKIDAEKGEGVPLAARYVVRAYPTLLVLDAQGKEVARQTGYVPADRFTRFLEDARLGRGSVAAIQAKIAKGDDTIDNRVALTVKAIETRDFATARAQLAVLAVRDTAQGGAQTADLWLSLVRAEGAGGTDPAGTLRDGEGFRARWPVHDGRFEVLELEANAHRARAEKDSAIAKYRAIRDGRANDPNALAAFARFCAGQRTALDEALAAAMQAVTLTDGKNAGVFDALADVYAARGQFDQAVDMAQKAVDLFPNDGARRGRLELLQEQAVEALHAPKPANPAGDAAAAGGAAGGGKAGTP